MSGVFSLMPFGRVRRVLNGWFGVKLGVVYMEWLKGDTVEHFGARVAFYCLGRFYC